MPPELEEKQDFSAEDLSHLKSDDGDAGDDLGSDAADGDAQDADAGKGAAKSDGDGHESVLDDIDPDAEDPKKVVAPADWPDDWREKAVGYIKDDKARAKELKRLQRMKTPEDIHKSYRALETKQQTEFIRKLPDGATEEQVAEWRKEMGIPEKPDAYDLPKVEGYEWGEADKPMLDVFLGKMHAAHADQKQIDSALGAYAELVTQTKEHQYNLDKNDDEVCVDGLRAKWGNEYRTNLATAKQLLNDTENFSPELSQMLREARTPDGNRLIYNPDLWEVLADMGLQQYGAGAGLTGDAKVQHSARKAEIETIMKTDMSRYWQEGLDKEYNEILAKENAPNSRSRAA